ncbi:MAG: acyltransferase [Marinoscillum sp.]
MPNFLRNLQRITTSNSFIPEIDGLRFIAIMLVALNHVAGIIEKHNKVDYIKSAFDNFFVDLIRMGNLGVEFFFVISGFILALPFYREKFYTKEEFSLTKYFRRRLTRLEPPYVITLVVFFYALILMNEYSVDELFPHFLASLFYCHNLLFDTNPLVNKSAWSLEIEIQFYLLVPILMYFLGYLKMRRFRRLLILVLIVISSYLSLHYQGPKSLFLFFQFFIAGIFLADLYLGKNLKKASKPLLYDLLGVLVVGVFIAYSHAYDAIFSKSILPWLFLTFIVSVFKGYLFNHLLTKRWVIIIGGMCYTIYLIHAQLIGLIYRYIVVHLSSENISIDIIIMSLVIMPIVFAFSVVFYKLVERPCMDPLWPKMLKQWLLGRLQLIFKT